MSFQLLKTKSGVRSGVLLTAHGEIKTPFFMPVGTVGSVKSVAPWELEKMGAEILLSNTYHLYLRPGEKLIKNLGGLHQFMGWNKPILTDSGGYQVFSLSKNNIQSDPQTKLSDNKRNGNQESLVKITDDGVIFKSFLDGSEHLFTPEKVIDIQLDLGVDILMPLDVCPSGKASEAEIKKACEITLDWARRSKLHFDQRMKSYDPAKRPLLHGIIQGGLYEHLRRWHTAEMMKIDFDGYSVGGLAVDYETRDMWKTVKLMGELLPQDKQRYLMGVGTPDDILKATKLGMDMFDCVLPTRLARHGNVFVKKQDQKSYETLNLLNSKYRDDGGVIDPKCGCDACSRGMSRAYISHLIRSNEILGIRLTTLHNLVTYLDLMRQLQNQ